jgi:hypothetical protein
MLYGALSMEPLAREGGRSGVEIQLLLEDTERDYQGLRRN